MMRRIVFACAVFLLSFLVAGFVYSADDQPVKAKKGDRTFESVYDNLNPKENTDIHIKAFWKKVDGIEVIWEGDVHDVKGGRGRAKIYLDHADRPSKKGFNMLLTTYDMSKAIELKKGQHIRFSAILYNYKRTGSSGIILYLDNAEIM
ncbi:MAG: hypothetical protein V3V59_01285 [Thermodesulfovibrionales bacterium]